MKRGVGVGALCFSHESHVQHPEFSEHLIHLQQLILSEHLIHVSRLVHGRNMLCNITVLHLRSSLLVKVLCFLVEIRPQIRNVYVPD